MTLVAVVVAAERFLGAPVPTLVLAAATVALAAGERRVGVSPRSGRLDDVHHLVLTTLLVRLTGIHLVFGAAARAGLVAGPLAGTSWWVRAGVGLVVLDALGYLVHRAHHEIPVLWRVHRVHHAVTSVDVWVKARRHPLDEVVLVAVWTPAAWLLGLGGTAFTAIVAVNTVAGLVSHSALWVRPCALDVVLVTPWVHHRHHSTHTGDYAGVLRLWDLLGGTCGHGPPGPVGPGAGPATGDWLSQLSAPWTRPEAVVSPGAPVAAGRGGSTG